jgi:hypothetical protein
MTLRVLYHLARVDLERFPVGPGATMATLYLNGGEPKLWAPMSGRPCVAYYLCAHLYEADWIYAFEESVASDFLVADGAARGRVIGARANLALAQPRTSNTHYCPESLRPLVEARGFSPAAIWFFRETILEPGDRIVVAGMGGREADPDSRAQPGYRGPAGSRSVIQQSDGFPLAISNNPVVFPHSHEEILIPS